MPLKKIEASKLAQIANERLVEAWITKIDKFIKRNFDGSPLVINGIPNEAVVDMLGVAYKEAGWQTESKKFFKDTSGGWTMANLVHSGYTLTLY